MLSRYFVDMCFTMRSFYFIVFRFILLLIWGSVRMLQCYFFLLSYLVIVCVRMWCIYIGLCVSAHRINWDLLLQTCIPAHLILGGQHGASKSTVSCSKPIWVSKFISVHWNNLKFRTTEQNVKHYGS